MIYVDVERLLTNATFKRRVAEAAKKFTGRADVVLSPAHPAASALGAIVASTLGVRHIPCEQKAYENLEGKDAHALRAAEAILFVDDVAITGGRIRRVKAALGQARIITDKRDVELNMLVGVARPVGAAEWAGVQDMVGPENLRAVEFIELPNWGQEDCPWCSELARLLAFEKTHRIGGALASRLARLKQVEKGLDAELFLPSSPSAGGVQRAFVTEPIGEQAFQEAGAALPRQVVRTYPFSELGQGSIFGQLKEVELFVAVAASLQRLRNDRELSERSQYPLSRVLDPYLYFLGRFYANIIVACVLRGAKRRDLRTVDLEPVLRKAVGERLLEVESLELRAELLLAIYRTQLPLPQEASQTDVFARLDPSIAEFAHWLLNPGP